METVIDFDLLADQLAKTSELLRTAAANKAAEAKKKETTESGFLTVDQAAAFLGLRRASLYRMTHYKTIPFYKPTGKALYFKIEDLRAWLSRRRVKSLDEIESETALLMVKKDLQ